MYLENMREHGVTVYKVQGLLWIQLFLLFFIYSFLLM